MTLLLDTAVKKRGKIACSESRQTWEIFQLLIVRVKFHTELCYIIAPHGNWTQSYKLYQSATSSRCLMDKNAYFDGVSPALLFVTQLYLPSSSSFTPPSDSWFCMMFLSSSKNWNDSCPWVWVCSIQIIVLDPCDIWLRKTSGRTVKSYIGTEKKQFCRGQLRLAKINTTQQIVCVQIPCILVNNDLHSRTYLATIRSCCFLQDCLKILC